MRGYTILTLTGLKPEDPAWGGTKKFHLENKINELLNDTGYIPMSTSTVMGPNGSMYCTLTCRIPGINDSGREVRVKIINDLKPELRPQKENIEKNKVNDWLDEGEAIPLNTETVITEKGFMYYIIIYEVYRSFSASISLPKEETKA